MINKLPQWIKHSAFILALVAGCINAIGLLGFEHQSVSHVSGTVTLVGTTWVNGSTHASLQLLGILISFLLGASLSGFIVHSSTLKIGRNYDVCLVAESILIFIAYFLLTNHSFYGLFAATAACGVQNALATSYSGAIIRSTHLTGIFTDLGLMLGSALKGKPFDKGKAKLFIFIILGFVLGGTLGTYLFAYFEFSALLFPAVICLLLAAIYHFTIKHTVNAKV
ncbi:YoaK family protein [Pseudocolwellia agarivorans]|uniref:YoaK family protein n=1 Tax=Pseudocolwellia agarivorans TaxID=1911682 RepID=UPI000985C142|nr:YoaK family protein [Pseudocolwellia agarivorans]